MTGTPIKTKDGTQIGTLKGAVLYKYVKKKRHLFRSIGAHGSWGIDYDILMNQLPERGSVYIKDEDDGILYMVTNARWREHGEILHFKKGTDDHNTQVFLPLEYFNKTKYGL